LAHYLVTGGAGFIGSHLCDSLQDQGHTVDVLDDLSTGRRDNLRPGTRLTVEDCANPPAVQAGLAQADGVFHLAAIASVQRGNEDWLGTHRANQTATITVLDAARARRLPVVYASSAATYGNNPDLPLGEASRQAPLTAYGADKLGSELHARVAWAVHGVPTAGLRFFNVYGPRQDPASPYSGVISIFAGRIAARQPITLHGDGLQTRDFVYVADVVRHLLAAMAALHANPQALVANVCSGRATSVAELAGAMARLSGWSAPEIGHGPPRAGDIRHSLGDPNHAIATLSLRAETPLDAGLAETLAWLGRN
jgi:UDP-glucose 4-epimerase